jgi:hypothetical protein
MNKNTPQHLQGLVYGPPVRIGILRKGMLSLAKRVPDEDVLSTPSELPVACDIMPQMGPTLDPLGNRSEDCTRLHKD